MPSWGKVDAETVPVALDIRPFKEPGSRAFTIAARGFVPGETVNLYQSYTEEQQPVLAAATLFASIPADVDGVAHFEVNLDPSRIPAGTEVVWYQARGETSGKETAPIAQTVGTVGSLPSSKSHVYLPLVER
jgi:hypothetical protein